jgi:hypothetical protein
MPSLFRCSILLSLIGLTAISLHAAIFPSDTGTWPDNWPKELEPYRAKSKTLGVGTGLQENIYTIPFESREEFEKIWPLLLKQTTPGSKVRLLLVSDKEHPTWGKFLKNDKPCVHVYAPSEGLSVNPKLDLSPEDFQKKTELLIKAGQMIRASAPWPEYLYGEDGGLPEYVASSLNEEDGKMKWKPAQVGDGSKGFYHRARVDIDLVIDGKIIDLNRIRFPEHVAIVDQREN